LRDTSYAARLAVKYLGLLYGGDIDPDGKLRIQPGRGRATQYLRDVWRLNRILNDGGEKSRDDHRHHAVDAVAIALTTPGVTRMLSDAAKRAPKRGREKFAEIPPPWEGFLEDVRAAVDEIVVSHRVSRKVRGRLHEDTIYGPPKTDEDGKVYHPVRKRLENFGKRDAENIIDPVIRELVKKKLEEVGNDLKKLESDPPYLVAKNGRKIPIKKARVKVYQAAFPVGPDARHVHTDTNHHVEILEVTDKKGKTKWEGEIVSLYEAKQRHKRGEPIIKRDHGEGKKFLFSLAGGEAIEIDENDGSRGIYVIRTISKMKVGKREYTNLAFVKINDARKKKDIIKAKEWRTSLTDPLRKLNCRKVLVTPLGEVREAND